MAIAKKITVEVYRISNLDSIKFDFGMKVQIRNASMLLSDNLAEGFECNNNPDFIQFLVYAKGSSGKLRNKLMILFECGKIIKSDYENLYKKLLSFLQKQKVFLAT